MRAVDLKHIIQMVLVKFIGHNVKDKKSTHNKGEKQ